ncbi:MAG: S41 family peptidase [Defluviitaleaceae bacterium]|nr:S41 family peptidase [Defluviitaleaceae bacterium]
MKKFIFVFVAILVLGLTACNADETIALEEFAEIIETESEEEIIETESEPEAEQESPTSFSEDAAIVIDFFESNHPIFQLPELMVENYNEMKAEFLEAAEAAENFSDFNFALLRYTTTLRDGHMSRRGFTSLGDFIRNPHIAQDYKLFLDNDGVPGAEILEIGGVPVRQILETIDRYFYYENEADRNLVHALMSRNGQILERAGAVPVSEFFTPFAVLTTEDEFDSPLRLNWQQARGMTGAGFIIQTRMLNDDVFLIDLRSLRNDFSVTQAETAIREAVDNGVRNFVVDLRDNGGGDSEVGRGLLAAMGITIPTQFHGALLSVNSYDVTVAVLTNGNTYSSATMFGEWVQDGGLGVIIGEPSSGAPTAFLDGVDGVFFVAFKYLCQHFHEKSFAS